MTEELSQFEKEYAEVLNEIRKQKKGSNIDEIIINFLKKQIKEIREGKRNEMDIGDVFGIGIQLAEIEGYKLSEKVEELVYELGDYKVEIGGNVLIGELGIKSIKDVEKEVKLLEAIA